MVSIFFFTPFFWIEDSNQMQRSFQCLAIPAVSKMVGSDPWHSNMEKWWMTAMAAMTMDNGLTTNNGLTWWWSCGQIPRRCKSAADAQILWKNRKILLPIKMGTCWRLCWISCSRWGGPLWVGRCFRNWWVLLTFGDSCSQLRLTKMTKRNDRGTQRQQLGRWAFQILNYYTSTDIRERYIYIYTYKLNMNWEWSHWYLDFFTWQFSVCPRRFCSGFQAESPHGRRSSRPFPKQFLTKAAGDDLGEVTWTAWWRLEHFLFFFSISYMVWLVCHPNPIDELIFFKMVETTNQWSFGNDSDGLIACFRLIFQSCARLGRGLSDVAGELFASAQLTSRGLPNLWSFGDNMITLWLFNIAIWKITIFNR